VANIGNFCHGRDQGDLVRTRASTKAWAITGVCALALALGTGSTALAQQAQASANANAGGGDVIVTAQRRSEPLQKVPLAVTAVSGRQLQQSTFTSLADIQFLAPSVQFQSGVSPEYQVRGVGTQTFDYGIEQSVGVFIDDVTQSLPRSPDLGTLADISQIEVLRGPQGTLFGKNTSAGAIVITTNKPQIGVFEDDAHFSYGTANEVVAQDTLNLPLTDDLAARLTGGYVHRDGYVDNLFTHEKLYEHDDATFNGKLLWRPTSNLEVYFIADYQSHRDNGSSVWTIRSYGTGDSGVNPAFASPTFIRDELTAFGVTPGPNNDAGAWDGPIYTRNNTEGAQVEVNYHLGDYTLTSVSAYRAYDYNVALEVDSTPLPIFDTNTGFIHSGQATQEFRITSPSGRPFEYVAGLYFYDLINNPGQLQGGTFGLEPDSSTTFLSSQGGAPRYHVDSRSAAIFGQGTYHITDKLGLIIGGRYTYDDLLSQYHVVPAANFCQVLYVFGAPCLIGPQAGALEVRHGDWSGRVGLQYNFDKDTMAYVTVARGYKGPTVNNILGASTPVLPETSIDYEGGVKSQWFDHRLTLNVALFYEQFTNFQAQTFDTTVNPPTFEEGNAGGLRSEGVEVEFNGRVTPELNISGGLTYADTYFTDYLTECDPGLCVGMIDPKTGVFEAQLFQARGDALTNAPRWTYTLAANWHHPLNDKLMVDASANWVWKSAVYFAVGDSNTIQPGYGLFNGNVGIGSPDGRWRLGLFARNLFDQHYVVDIIPTFFDTGGYANFPDPNGGSNRTIGVSLDMKLR
jgi:iron complex outermembrane receptor protein